MLKVSVITVEMNLIQNNRAEMFKECVASVRAQDYPAIEHIVIDGASTDGTIALLNELKCTYYSEPDTGIYNAMNKGIARATGDVIAFLNSDDYYADSTAISSVVAAFEKTNADVVIGDRIALMPNKKLCSGRSKMENLLYAMSVCHQSTFCKLDLIKSVGGFEETYKIAGDFHLIHKLLLSGYHFVFLNKVLSVFRLGGLSSDTELAKQESYKVLYDNYNHLHIKISRKQAEKIYCNKFFSPTVYLKVRKLINPQLRWRFDSRYLKSILKFLKHWLITVHLRRHRRLIRIFGIVLFCEEKS